MKWIVFALPFLMLLSLNELTNQPQRWVVYYSTEAPIGEFEPFDTIVLDSDYHPYLEGFIQRRKTILGYINLGEVENVRSHFSEVQDEGILLEENKNWPGSYYVDMRDKRWARRVIEELIPKILMKRFDGIFMDTLDNAVYLEQSDPEKYKGMIEAAVHLVKAIRLHYPQAKIMMNRGYELLPQVASVIDMELGESVYTSYDFEKKDYYIVAENIYREQLKILREAQKLNPKLKVYTLDYWNPEDTSKIKKIYEEQRKNGFIPYVATIKLNKIVPEP